MKPEAGKGLAIVLGGEKDDDDSEESSEFDTAAEECFHALKEGDLEGFKMALKNAMMCCSGED